jgi:DNA ligase-1
MKAFSCLYAALDASTSTRRKLAAMAAYFREAPPADAAWAAWFLAGARPRRLLPMAVLRETARSQAGVPAWLFEESYAAVGDLAETIALLLPPPQHEDDRGLDAWMRETLLPLRSSEAQAAGATLARAWSCLDDRGRFVMNKLLTGGLRVGVSRQLVVRAVAQAFEADEREIAQRFVGFADPARYPDAAGFLALGQGNGEGCGGGNGEGNESGANAAGGFPYPFFLAHPLQQAPQLLGAPADWLIEWKWDGMRAQLVRRDSRCWLWSRGEELVTERFPEIEQAAMALPEGTVIDGELLCWRPGELRPLPFAILQRRIGRLKPAPRLLREAPAVLLGYDLLEAGGADLRALPLAERRARLESLLTPKAGAAPSPSPVLRLSPSIDRLDWSALAGQRAIAREAGAEGLMLKRRGSAYGIGRTKSAPQGDWWKWKLDPMTADCVLVYAQRGHGRRAGLYTDYTFAVWSDSAGVPERRLVPVAKAYSGLTDAEIREVDAEIRRNTVEKFGPVRSVRPTMVFEIGFEGIARSTRHRAGLAVRFPRMLRRRPDKPVEEADTLASLQALLAATDPG